MQTGDTVSGLAHRFNVPAREILHFNDISDPRTIRTGDVIYVPYRGSKKSGASGERKWDPKDKNYLDLGIARKHIGRMDWPIGGQGKLTSEFGRRWFSFHEGIDLSAPSGSPIYAAHAGLVVYSDNGMSGYGNLVAIRGDHILTVYAHNKSNRVSKGERVKIGQHIADVGATGKAKGPHLHFEVRIKDEDGKNVAVNPLLFFPGFF